MREFATSANGKRLVLRLALYAFVLNATWEIAQCPIFYEMAGTNARAIARMTSAVSGDVVAVLVLVCITGLLTGERDATSRKASVWLTLPVLSFVASIVLEWIPRAWHWWVYSQLMPTFPLLNVSVGLLPVAQITLLPSLSLYLATRRAVGASN